MTPLEATTPEFKLPTSPLDLIDADEVMRVLREREPLEIEQLVPQPVLTRLAVSLPTIPPEPFGVLPLSPPCWFDLMAVLGEHPEGVTAKQLARWLGQERFAPALGRLLDRLAQRGELRRSTKGAVRYHTRDLDKVLPSLLRQFSGRVPRDRWESFELSLLAYQDTSAPPEWTALVAALVEVVKAMPGWPKTIAGRIEADPAGWLQRLAGVEPPAGFASVEDPLVAELRAEVQRLKDVNAGLNAQLELLVAELVAEEEHVAVLDAENEALRAQLHEAAELSQSVSQAAEAFLAAKGRGGMPDMLSDSEINRLRALVLDTRADRPAMLAIVAGLAAIYEAPTAHQRLTTLSFKDHPFHSLWRARVGKYRIVYGLLHHQPHPLTIGTRGEVYEQMVHALRHRHL